MLTPYSTLGSGASVASPSLPLATRVEPGSTQELLPLEPATSSEAFTIATRSGSPSTPTPSSEHYPASTPKAIPAGAESLQTSDSNRLHQEIRILKRLLVEERSGKLPGSERENIGQLIEDELTQMLQDEGSGGPPHADSVAQPAAPFGSTTDSPSPSLVPQPMFGMMSVRAQKSRVFA